MHRRGYTAHWQAAYRSPDTPRRLQFVAHSGRLLTKQPAAHFGKLRTVRSRPVYRRPLALRLALQRGFRIFLRSSISRGAFFEFRLFAVRLNRSRGLRVHLGEFHSIPRLQICDLHFSSRLAAQKKPFGREGKKTGRFFAANGDAERRWSTGKTNTVQLVMEVVHCC